MSRPMYKKGDFIIVQNMNRKKAYYTVINTKSRDKKHTHLYTFQQAKLVLHWARKGEVPSINNRRYSHHMRESIERIINKEG